MEASSLHNTPALIFADGPRCLHLWIRGRRGMLLRFIPAEPATPSRLGSETELLGQPERRSCPAPSEDPRALAVRVHPTRSIRQHLEVRGEERSGPGGEGHSPFPVPCSPFF